MKCIRTGKFIGFYIQGFLNVATEEVFNAATAEAVKVSVLIGVCVHAEHVSPLIGDEA